MSVPQLGIYRTEAVEYHARSRTDGELLMLLPGWTRWSYRLLVSLLLAAALFIIFGSVSQYAEGPAVIRAADRVPVTTTPTVRPWNLSTIARQAAPHSPPSRANSIRLHQNPTQTGSTR